MRQARHLAHPLHLFLFPVVLTQSCHWIEDGHRVSLTIRQFSLQTKSQYKSRCCLVGLNLKLHICKTNCLTIQLYSQFTISVNSLRKTLCFLVGLTVRKQNYMSGSEMHLSHCISAMGCLHETFQAIIIDIQWEFLFIMLITITMLSFNFYFNIF